MAENNKESNEKQEVKQEKKCGCGCTPPVKK